MNDKSWKFWCELFEMWLKSIGAEIMGGGGQFFYKKHHFKYWIGSNIHGLDAGGPYIDIKNRGFWVDLDLDLHGIDPYDPSSDPNKFFAPVKELMDSKPLSP